MKKAVGYCRYSSSNQREESIEAQIRAIEQYCKTKGIELIRFYKDEAISGTSIKDRESFLEMISDSKTGEFELVIVHKYDRFARNRYDHAIFERKLNGNNVLLISVLEELNDSPESIILKSVLTGMNEYYSLNLSREVKKGKKENALKGVHNGGLPPLGYNLDENKKYIVNQEEAKIVRLIFSLAYQGLTYADIANTLNEQGYKNKSGSNFKKTSIIGDQVEKNPEYLSILDKKAIKNEKIDDDVQKEQVSVMNKLLNDALRAKGYAGPDIKMVLTDVTDPNGPFYTDTLTNVVVFDRKQLANLDRDKILNILGHEFGHYSKEDNKTGNQTIANYSGDKLEDRTKAMVSKEATKDTLASIRNNPNVITGEEGKKLAESIPMDRREYKGYGFSVGLSFSTPYGGGGGALMKGISVDDETGETYIVTVVNGSIDWSPEFSFEIGSKMSFFPNVNQPEDFEGTSLGLSISFLSVFSGEISVDLDSFKIDEASVGISKSFKEVDKAIEEAIAISPSIAKKLKPLDALKKKYNIKRDIGVSLGFGHVSDKIKVKTKDSEKLYILIKEEKILKAHLENANLTKPQKEKLKREIDLNLALQKELVKKIANIKKVKIPKVDGDIYD